MIRIAAVLGIVIGAGSILHAGEPSPGDLRFFETKVRPLLIEHCYKCHGPDKQKSDLRLDSAAALKKGGSSGTPIIDAKAPKESLLLKAVRHAKSVEAMPPGKKLSDAEIGILTTWVVSGAPFPTPMTVPADDPSRHWAFQPITLPKPPKVRDEGWAKTDVDRFILARLENAGQKPAAPAEKRILIRRVTFDLTGLPPTPDEVEAFVADTSPDAYPRLVNRLLASPAYGERWGRHWLDIVRYADSNGLDENVAHGNAWRYRDYVIESFNKDKPYDRFVTEQIAGDLLPSNSSKDRNTHLIATGFLGLGPKVLAEPDERKMELDIVDEQLDTVGRAILGLTLGCARCHDHKFDPITTADYYGLAGIFASTKTMENFKKVARWYENPLDIPADVKKKKAEHDQAVTKLKEAIAVLEKKSDDASKADLKAKKDELTKLEKAAPEVPSAMGATEGTITDLTVMKRGNHLTPGTKIPRRYPVVLGGESQKPLPADKSGRVEMAHWLTNPTNPLTARVMVNRVWRWHFGTGLVRSVDNFGLLGDKPTHPELLDWLASDFIRQGWSLKALHRTIVLSAAYQTSSHAPASLVTADPDNRLQGRFARHRLEAEAIRDALLAVSGQLDRTLGGPALAHVTNRGYLFDHTSKDMTRYDSPRRSVYLPVIRNNLYDVFQLFDAPDAAVPNGDRATTTVPTQALFFLNSDLVRGAAEGLAKQVSKLPDDTARINRLFQLAYGRLPSDFERSAVTRSLAQLKAEGPGDPAARTQRAWLTISQALLASNEFITVE